MVFEPAGVSKGFAAGANELVRIACVTWAAEECRYKLGFLVVTITDSHF